MNTNETPVNGQSSEARQTRKAWTRPQLLRLDAGKAELGATINPDGGSTFS